MSTLHVPPTNPASPPKSILKKGNDHRKSINDVKLVLDGHVPEAEEDDNSPRHAKTKMFVEGKEGVVKKGEKKLHPSSPRQNNDAIGSDQHGNDSDSDTDSEPLPEETISPRKDAGTPKGAIQPRKTSSASQSTAVSSSSSSSSLTSAASGSSASPSTKKEGGIFSKVFKKSSSSSGKSKDKK